MKNILYLLSVFIVVISCKQTTTKKIDAETSKQTDTVTKQVQQVAEFKGQQITGVTVSSTGRIFVNFPRWRKGVKNSVVEITKDNQKLPYPNKEWNSWEIGSAVENQKFIGVQSVIAFENKLYVLDTRNPLFGTVLDAPRLFVFNLSDNKLEKTYLLQKDSYYPNSYINDLRVDKKNNKIYCTDSGRAGLIVLDITSGKSTRVLNNHFSTKAEQSYLTFNNKKWENTVNSDGIALDTKNDLLYFHALTGYSLYSVSTKVLANANNKEVEKSVKLVAKTSAPDGMILDENGTLYFADLENNKIMYRKQDGSIHILVEGDKIKWADTFSIFNNDLYFTNSRINEVTGDISTMTFTLNKIELSKN
ncbi:sugar lactone lactonase YvrE [Flavobacterium sp. CG_9.10]|uniref:L-dopachrome tautomerase-related protein n=1 Tax=Flavobacterium sp. CG_9.10 TaxID=2787729 RepID=UPI0018CA858E|nr:L-dopachrome tautomerase-related protein [Flavobacterium sp. CG_9.10]MBG6112114.1 sugar lactone lactonase YvrE [Flavobacterium sp. CG_9.10]